MLKNYQHPPSIMTKSFDHRPWLSKKVNITDFQNLRITNVQKFTVLRSI